MLLEINSEENKNYFYVMATPIGNIKDITLRALDILKEQNIIFCEDTRRTKKLLDYYNIKNKKIFSYNDINKKKSAEKILNFLKDSSVVLVSDAGTPAISDPGYYIIKLLNDNGFTNIVCVPGASSITAAISISGLPSDNFIFLGFLPKTRQSIVNKLEKYVNLKSLIVFLESPKRLETTIEILKNIFGNQKIMLARELTKKFEEKIIFNLNEFSDIKHKINFLGEFTILLYNDVDEKTLINQEILKLCNYLINDLKIDRKQILKDVSNIFNIKKKLLYDNIINND